MDDLITGRAHRDYERLLGLLDGMDRLLDSQRCLLYAIPLPRHGQTLAGIANDLIECVEEARAAVARLFPEPDDVV